MDDRKYPARRTAVIFNHIRNEELIEKIRWYNKRIETLDKQMLVVYSILLAKLIWFVGQIRNVDRLSKNPIAISP